MTQTVAPDIHTAIQAVNQQFMAAHAQGDALGVAALYTEDSELLPAGRRCAGAPRSRRSGRLRWTWGSPAST